MYVREPRELFAAEGRAAVNGRVVCSWAHDCKTLRKVVAAIIGGALPPNSQKEAISFENWREQVGSCGRTLLQVFMVGTWTFA